MPITMEVSILSAFRPIREAFVTCRDCFLKIFNPSFYRVPVWY